MSAIDAQPSGMSARQFAGRILAVMAAGLVALSVMAGTAWWLVHKANAFGALVEHTYAAESKISRFQSLLERTETARRGYLLAASPDAWRTYETSAALVPDQLRDLEAFISDNPAQTRRIAELHPYVEQLLGMMTEVMTLAETGERDRAIQLFRAGQELQTMRKARALLSAMLDEEQRLVRTRSAEQNAYSQRLFVIVLLGAVLVGLLSVGAVWTIQRYAADLIAAQESLRRLNTGLEDQVRARTAELTRANEEIQRFAYIVSHDLRSPLVNVMGFTSELEASLKALRALVQASEARAPDAVSRDAKEAVEQDIPEAVGFIRSSTQKMDRLINAILKLSREGRRTLNPEPVDVSALAHTAADSLRSLADGRGAEIRVEGELPPLTTDRLALEQVLSNLMENAIKYAAPDRPGRVVVRGRPEADGVLYEIEDNGRGIDPKDHERVFELFRRAGAQDQPGEGIGLASVRSLVHRLGGRLTLTSELDRGSTFRLFLPPVLSTAREAAA